jgi:3-hydroxy-D-aspartate aldolase
MSDIDLHKHLIGQQGSRFQLNTPVLVIDRDALQRNIEKMAAFARSQGHGAAAACEDAQECRYRQACRLAAGAVGVCCAKMGEAEALARRRRANILITSPVVTPQAIARLVALNGKIGDLRVVADNPNNVDALAAAAARGAEADVIVDIDPGIRRTGVPSARKLRWRWRNALRRAVAALCRRAILLRRAAAHRIVRRSQIGD